MGAYKETPEGIAASPEKEQTSPETLGAVQGVPPKAEKEKPAKSAPKEGVSSTFVLVRMQDTRPRHLDGGRTVLRPSLPFDATTRLASCFLDLYIGARYAPSPSRAGCICHATVLAGTVSLMAEGQTLQLLERDALRFAADQPYAFENMSNGTGRLLLEYQYL
ncbi:MAG: cupin domain-containing protein [Oscillibacter sp.]|nr:cupin domain-containing protein [Oscillibacter sp.]